MIRTIASAGMLALLAAAPQARADGTTESAIVGWPGAAQLAARSMAAKYGKPDEAGPDALVWRSNGPWKRTAVYRAAWPRSADGEAKNFLENAIRYPVPDDKVEVLARFDGRLDADPKSGELSARSDGEATNFLLLNLAYQIVGGKRTVKEARDFLVKVQKPSEAGKPSPYLMGLMFETGDVPARKPCGCRQES